jgi:hypothetical protein
VDHRLREDHALERDDRRRIAQRLARRHLLEADAGGDVAGQHLLELLAIVGVHLQHAADPLLAPLDRVVHGIAGLEHARVDADEGELPDVRVGHQLEGKGRELGCIGRFARFRPAVLAFAGHRRNVDRRRQESMTASSMRCTPLFLKAVPHNMPAGSRRRWSAAAGHG